MSNLDQQIAWPLIAIVAIWAAWEAIKWAFVRFDERNTAYVERMVAAALADGEAEWELWLSDVTDLDPTPIYDRLAAEVFADELADDVAVARWLG